MGSHPQEDGAARLVLRFWYCLAVEEKRERGGGPRGTGVQFLGSPAGSVLSLVQCLNV